ncbi:hypothetical protein PVA38_11120 [Streptococcus pneumoniae D39]|nr:hypothetical protein PVA38_11120 [Streptococcus pneumoniae D39]
MITHDEKIKNKNYYNFFDSEKGKFPYTDAVSYTHLTLPTKLEV